MPAPPEVYAFSLIAAIAWGLGPVITKSALEREDGGAMLATVVTILTSFALFFIVATVTYGPSETYLGLDARAATIFLLSGVLGSAIARLLMYVGVDRVGASVNTAVVNSRPLFAAMLAIGFLAEPFSGALGLGILTIIVGVMVLSLSRGGDISGWKWYQLGFPLAAAMTFALGNVLRRYGFVTTDSGVLGALVLNELAAVGIIVGYVLATRGRTFIAVSRRTYALFILGGSMEALGVLLLFAALSLGPVIVVDPLTATAPLFAALFTFVLLRRVERVTWGVIVGAILVLLGVVFITLG